MGRLKPKKLPPESPPRFKVGDWVHWTVGNSTHLAVVTEDRGPVGVRARRLYRLREYSLWTDVMDYGLYEEYLTPAERPAVLPEPHHTLPVP